MVYREQRLRGEVVGVHTLTALLTSTHPHHLVHVYHQQFVPLLQHVAAVDELGGPKKATPKGHSKFDVMKHHFKSNMEKKTDLVNLLRQRRYLETLILLRNAVKVLDTFITFTSAFYQRPPLLYKQ